MLVGKVEERAVGKRAQLVEVAEEEKTGRRGRESQLGLPRQHDFEGQQNCQQKEGNKEEEE